MAPRIKKILITAGPTREMIDPVRFISNLSTGEMGYALAKAAAKKNYRVTLVSGPVALKPPSGVRFIPITTAQELQEVCARIFPAHDALIMTAAVCDFTPAQQNQHKIPSAKGMVLRLKRTPDILASLARRKGNRTVIGFCLETKCLVERSKHKIRNKGLNGIVANHYDPKKHIPFGDRKINVALIDVQFKVQRLFKQPKRHIAGKILEWMEALRK